MVIGSLEEIRIKPNSIDFETEGGIVLDKFIIAAKEKWFRKGKTVQKDRSCFDTSRK